MPPSATEPDAATRVMIRARDGWLLAATVYPAGKRRARGVALVAAAMGVTQERYAAFARFLARDGWTVVTFDYRGMGGSRAARPGARPPTMVDWGRDDVAAMLAWIEHNLRPTRLVAIAHSIGGQLLPLAPNSHRLSAVLAVCTPKSFWRLWRGPQRLLVYAFFRLIVPLALRLFGRLPMRLAGLGDLPRGVARDWAATSSSADYRDARGRSWRHRFARFRAPILALSFRDDSLYAPAASVDYLMQRYYVNAPQLRLDIDPAAHGLAGVGHSGFFSGRVPESWWRSVSRWLAWPIAPNGGSR